MNKELLMLHGAAYAVSQMIGAGSWGYRLISAERKMETVEWSDILDYLLSLIEECKENGGI